MSTVNTRVVRRSRMLLQYGETFRYQESMSCGRGTRGWLKAIVTTAGLAAFVAAASFSSAHGLIRRVVQPSPRREGFFRVHFLAATATGKRLAAHAAGTGDPGCEATAIMLAESALCLAENHATSARFGVLTPASAMGTPLLDRLRRQGISFEMA